MADLSSSTSSFSTGGLDTWTSQIANVSLYKAAHVNGLASGILQLEAVLGSGSALPGSLASLAARLAVQIGSDGIIIPPGAAMDYYGVSAPTGWLFCDGSAVSRLTYAALFTAIGITYGPGDGTTTFHLPDRRGRLSVGAGTGTGGDTSGTGLISGGIALIARAIGAWFGADMHTMSQSELFPHTHALRLHDGNGVTGVNIVGSSSTVNQSSIDSQPTGDGSAWHMHPPSLVCNVIIKI